MNPDLQGKNSLVVMDIVIEEMTKNGMFVLLDHHRPDCNAISDTPMVAGYSLDDWIRDLVFVTQRYKNNPLVFGIDIKNEPHGTARWGNGNIATDWKMQAEKAGQAVLAENPNLLIFVEGIEKNDGDCQDNLSHWWG
jgi:endoglucanase